MPWDTDLIKALKELNVDKVTDLMSQGVDANARRAEDQHTPLTYAVIINHLPLVQAMVGSEPFKFTPDSVIAILEAVDRGHFKLLPILLNKHTDKSISIDRLGSHGKTPLRIAVDKGDLDSVILLLEHGANPNELCKEDNETPLSMAVKLNPRRNDLVKAMIGSENFVFDSNTVKAVLEAVKTEQPELLPLLLKKHTDKSISLDSCTSCEKTARWLAVEKGYGDAVDLLSEHGAAVTPDIIPRADLAITIEKLGTGGCATVFAGTWNQTKVAVKQYIVKNTGVAESMLMAQAQHPSPHPHIVILHGVVERPSGISLIIEYMDNGDFYEYLKMHPRENQNDFKIAYEILLQIAQALEFVHANLIIHFDVKGGNILLNKQLCAKLCDFGLSRRLDPSKNYVELTDNFGTPNSVSPEMLQEKQNGVRKITTANDIFTLGLALSVAATENDYRPFSHLIRVTEILRHIAEGGQPRIPPTTATEVVSLIAWCCKKDPGERPTAAQVKESLQAIVRV